MTTPASDDTVDTSGGSGASGETGATFSFSRGERLFATRRSLAERIEQDKVAVPLVADQLYHPTVPCDVVVRLGSLRVTRFLPDDREVTLAVLQAGNNFTTRAEPPSDPRPGDPPPDDLPRSDPDRSHLYKLADVVLMALGDTELWILPAGALTDDG